MDEGTPWIGQDHLALHAEETRHRLVDEHELAVRPGYDEDIDGQLKEAPEVDSGTGRIIRLGWGRRSTLGTEPILLTEFVRAFRTGAPSGRGHPAPRRCVTDDTPRNEPN